MWHNFKKKFLSIFAGAKLCIPCFLKTEAGDDFNGLCISLHAFKCILQAHIFIKQKGNVLDGCSPCFQSQGSVNMFYPVCSAHTCVHLLSRTSLLLLNKQ